MDLLAQTNVPFVLAKPQRVLAVSGAVLAFVGLIVAVCAPAFLEAKHAPAQTVPEVLVESAHKIKSRFAHKDIDVEPQRRISWKGTFVVAGALLGFLGSALGTASWVRRENPKLGGIAISTGLTAIAWNYFAFAAIAAAALFLMAWIISHFHR